MVWKSEIFLLFLWAGHFKEGQMWIASSNKWSGGQCYWKQGSTPRLRSIFRIRGRRCFFNSKERMVMSSKVLVLCRSLDLAWLENHTSKRMQPKVMETQLFCSSIWKTWQKFEWISHSLFLLYTVSEHGYMLGFIALWEAQACILLWAIKNKNFHWNPHDTSYLHGKMLAGQPWTALKVKIMWRNDGLKIRCLRVYIHVGVVIM